MGSDTVMGTAERLETSVDDGAGRVTASRGTQASDLVIPAAGQGTADRDASEETGTAARTPRSDGIPEDDGPGEARREQAAYRPLWIEEPARRRRLPDPVRTAAVRAVIIIAVTLVQAVVAFLCAMAGSWLAFPMVISSVASTVAATWGALDVWVTRQVWNQRNGVVSTPSSTARALRRERRRARRQARAAERAQERIRRHGGAGRLSHS
jgi:hypothetical protein